MDPISTIYHTYDKELTDGTVGIVALRVAGLGLHPIGQQCQLPGTRRRPMVNDRIEEIPLPYGIA